jgi:hypothetical protein
VRLVALLFPLPLVLSACATTQPRPQARLHSQQELNLVAQSCGLALGELVQEADATQLLFVFRVAPTAEERACVARWARQNMMRTVIIEAVNDPEA